MALSPDQLQIIEDFNVNVSDDDKQRTRAFFQGLSLGFADEIEGLAVSLYDQATGGDLSYEDARNEIRAKLDKYNKEHPTESLNYELLGAIAPTAASLLLTGGTTTAGVTAPLATKVGTRLLSGRSIAVGGGVGGATAYGTGEEGVVEDLARVPVGTAFGAGSTAVAAPLITSGGKVVDKAMGFINEKFGDKVSKSVSNEINRLAQEMGLLPEEVIEKVAKGEIMATNQTLQSTMRALRTEFPDIIDPAIKLQKKKTRDEALETMREELVPGIREKNIFKNMRKEDSQFKADENKAYKKVFEDAPDLNGEIIDSITEAIRRMPEAKTLLDKIYRAKGDLVPFYKITDNGAIKIVRMPTLEDAEIVRRTLAETVRSEYKGGSAQVAGSLDELQKKLRLQLDDFSAPLKNVRNKAKIYRSAKDMFDEGRKVLNKNPDEMAVMLEQMSKRPTRENVAMTRSFRAGVMDALQQKLRQNPAYINQLADPERQAHQLLRTVFPEENIETVISRIEAASKSRIAVEKIMGGSPTAPQQRAENVLGLGSLGARASAGDSMALLELTQKAVNKLRPGMTQPERQQLSEILVSSNSEDIRKAFFNEGGIAKLQELINRITNVGGRMGVGTAIPSGEYGAESTQSITNSLFGN